MNPNAKDILTARVITSGETTKMHYQIGHYDISGDWHIMVVSGDLFTNYLAAITAADKQIRIIIAACKKQDAKRRADMPSATSQGGAA
jgi:hypothetical protein